MIDVYYYTKVLSLFLFFFTNRLFIVLTMNPSNLICYPYNLSICNNHMLVKKHKKKHKVDVYNNYASIVLTVFCFKCASLI